jgi:hypothetical protein
MKILDVGDIYQSGSVTIELAGIFAPLTLRIWPGSTIHRPLSAMLYEVPMTFFRKSAWGRDGAPIP